MGVTFKPSVRYKIDSNEYNILKDPSLDVIKAQVDTHRKSDYKRTLASPKSVGSSPNRKKSGSPITKATKSPTSPCPPAPRTSAAPAMTSPKMRSRSYLNTNMHAKMERAYIQKKAFSGTSSSTASLVSESIEHMEHNDGNASQRD